MSESRVEQLEAEVENLKDALAVEHRRAAAYARKSNERKNKLEEAEALIKDLSSAKLEANRLYRYLNGLEEDDIDKRAELFIHMFLDGFPGIESGRLIIKAALADNFADLLKRTEKNERS